MTDDVDAMFGVRDPDPSQTGASQDDDAQNTTQETNPYDFDAQEAADPNPQEIRGIKWKNREYVLKRATADAVVKFTNARLRNARITQEEDSPLRTITPVGGGDLPYLLVSMCLFLSRQTATGQEQLIPVPIASLKVSWPPHVVEKLYDDAKRISYIDAQKDPHKRLAEIERERKKILRQIGAEGNGRGGERLVEIGAVGRQGDGAEDEVGN